jgi:DNA-binding beta-propeller fold protein YncE
MKKRSANSLIMAATGAGLAIAFGVFCLLPLQAQVNPPKFEVDPYWPKPLPDHWAIGSVNGLCVDAQDHVFIDNVQNLDDNELDAAHQAPPMIEFDPDGNVVNSWGDPNVLGKGRHGCFVDHDNNVWLPSNQDGIVQKYTHDGSKLLLQIGTRGVIDSSDGTITGVPLNSSQPRFFRPEGLVVDPSNGDIYVADGEEPGSNHRVAVLDRNGRFLRQWGLQRTKAEAEAGEGDVFMQVVHCVAMGNDGLVYVCARRGDRIQVFDKMGNFQKNILIPYEQRSQYQPEYNPESIEFTGPEGWPRSWGTEVAVDFSPDQAQRFMYVMNEDDEQVEIVDHASGKILGSFGRPGHQAGEFEHAHSLAVDSKGNIYVAEAEFGMRVQKFKIVGSQ